VTLIPLSVKTQAESAQEHMSSEHTGQLEGRQRKLLTESWWFASVLLHLRFHAAM